MRSVSASWFVRPIPRPGAKMRLFCVPYAGSGAAAYRGWAENVGDLDVCYVQPPGRENRLGEAPFTSMIELVTDLANGVEPLLDRPYALYGHSLGGIVAFELARELRSRGRTEPLHLFASASRAPQLPNPYEPIRHLADLPMLEEIHKRYDSVPIQVMQDPELRELVVPCLRADITMLETYRHLASPPLACGITCFGATEDRAVTADAIGAWSIHTQSKFELHMFEGGHLFLQSGRSGLLSAVRAALNPDSQPVGQALLARDYGDCGAGAN